MSEVRAVLTGASGGIGRAVAERLAGAGARLALIGRDAAALAELGRRYEALTAVGDLTDGEFVAGLRERLAEHWTGGAEVLINNAGAFELAAVRDTEIAALETMLAVNLRAPFQLARAFLPEMMEGGSGHIVNVGSVAGRKAFPGNAAYSASKYGLRGLHEVLVEELRGTGIRVTWIEPSAVDTRLWDRFDPDRRSDLPSRGEMLRPQAVADAVLFALTRPADVAIEEIVIRSNPACRRG